MKIQKRDTVKVLTGKDAGRQGNVLRVMPEEQKIVVDGINIYKRHMKGDGQKKKSAIIEITKPLNISNVMLVCPSCGKIARVGFEMKGEKKVRICKKCKAGLDEKRATRDTAAKDSDKNKKKDTKKKTAAKKKPSKKSTRKKKASNKSKSKKK